MLVLQVLQGPDRGRKFALPANEPQLIGRSSEALPLTDSTVSRRHAELTPDDGAWYLRDLRSSNGTFVNGQRIASAGAEQEEGNSHSRQSGRHSRAGADRVRLSPGDQIRCGSTLFVFTVTGEEDRGSAVSLMSPEVFDVTVESTADANEESMVLASPDPVAAARDHLRVIYELTAVTASVFERQALLERVMDLVFEEFSPDRGFILLQDSPTARPEPVVVRYKVRPKTVDEGRIPVSRTIVAHTLEKGEGILSTNAMNDRRFRSGDSVQDYGIRSAICVPIRAAERTFGVIHIDSSLANFTFTEPQLQLMNAIAQHAGLALLSVEQVSSRMHTERLAAIGQTVASISHAIKNILQGLRGGADAVGLALNRGDLKLAREGWPILSRNLDRISSLVMNMLAYSRPPRLDIELASPHSLIEEAAQLLQAQCDRKRIALILELAEDMPPIPLDVGAIHQALMNLLTNAVEAVEPKRGVITVRTAFDPQRHRALITIADNGPGVPEPWRERIFEPFASTKGQRGTGLGLAVSRKIIREHGGRIELAEAGPNGATDVGSESQCPGGATFIIALPSDHGRLSAGETRLPRPLPRDAVRDEFDY